MGDKPNAGAENLTPPSPHAQRVGEGGRGDEGRVERWDVSAELRRQRVELAREFRKEPTVSERMLWGALRGRQVGGVKFRRQQPLGPFIVDFCAPALRLIIEVDGAVHLDPEEQERDRERQQLIERLGFRFLRFTADAVERDLAGVVALIERVVGELAEGRGVSPIS